MTPQSFVTTYRSTADTVAAATGLYPTVLLTQWACETAWGSSLAAANNLGNIRPASGIGFAFYPSLDAFAQAAIWVFENARPNLYSPVSASNNYYWPVLATKGAGPAAQIAALGASPWDAGHYNNGGGPGSGLVPYYQEITLGTVADLPDVWLIEAKGILDHFFGVGGTNTTPATTLAQLVADIKAIQTPSAASVDLSPVLAAIAALKAEVDVIKAQLGKDLAP